MSENDTASSIGLTNLTYAQESIFLSQACSGIFLQLCSASGYRLAWLPVKSFPHSPVGF